MNIEQDHPRISIDPAIMFGKPCIKGTRVPVYLIVMMFAEGETLEGVLEAYPHITAEDVRAALAYAADRSADTVLPAAE